MNGTKLTVRDYKVSGDYYVFSFGNIAPDKMNDTITAALYAERDGQLFVSEKLEYSIADYCYRMLAKDEVKANAKLCTLLVDLLRYGAASQTYIGYQTDALADKDLTRKQRAWGTTVDRELKSVTKVDYRTVENPSVKWVGASLDLYDSITMQFAFTADNLEDITVKVEAEGGNPLMEIPAKDFVQGKTYHYARFKGLTAGQMSETVLVTAYRGGEKISNTVAYSIESYAAAKQNGADKLADLVKTMMKYGDAASAYAK